MPVALGNRSLTGFVILYEMSIGLRGLAVVAIALGAVVFTVVPARASCIQQTQADQVARADVIAEGRVTSVDRGAGTLSFVALTVFKGDPGPGSLTVRVGPGGGAATSVDYRAEPGAHLLYLQGDGSAFATNDCSGSHPGPATAEELSLLRSGRVITYTAPDPGLLDQVGGAAAVIPVLGALLLIVAVLVRRGSSESARPR